MKGLDGIPEAVAYLSQETEGVGPNGMTDVFAFADSGRALLEEEVSEAHPPPSLLLLLLLLMKHRLSAQYSAKGSD
jgi:hypothetical protein